MTVLRSLLCILRVFRDGAASHVTFIGSSINSNNVFLQNAIQLTGEEALRCVGHGTNWILVTI